jgi:hypothetical protein
MLARISAQFSKAYNRNFQQQRQEHKVTASFRILTDDKLYYYTAEDQSIRIDMIMFHSYMWSENLIAVEKHPVWELYC